MIYFALTDAENGPIIVADKRGATYHIKVVKTDDGQKNAIVEDTQRIPFWRNLKRKDDFFKSVKSKVPDLTVEKWGFVCVELSAADEDGNIGEEKPDGEKGAEITDKFITDTIMTKHLFHCDITDVNQTLYVFTGDHWGNSEAESLILNELSEIFKGEERRTGMMKERTTDFIKGQAMNLKLIPKPPELIPFKNGLYDLTTGELKLHDRQYFYTNVIPHDYTPKARCPNFMKWLGEVIKLEDMEFLQEWLGYQFYIETPEAAFLILIGTGQNGKTVLITIIIKMLGEENVTNISLSALTYDVFERAELYHKLANISDDIGSETIRNAGKLKAISSGSRITIQRKFGHPHDINPYAKLTYAANEPPEIRDQTDAIRLRLKTIEFPYVFKKKPGEGEKLARDRGELENELSQEIPGIINWALEGLKRLIANKFKFSVAKSTEETWIFYQRKSNPVLAFIDECVNMTLDENDKIEPEAFYQLFCKWISDTHLKMRIKRVPFFKKLKEEGIETRQKAEDGRKRYYYGITVTASRHTHVSLLTSKEKIDKKEEIRKNKGYIEKTSRREAVTGTLEQHFNATSQSERIKRICEIIDALVKEYGGAAPIPEVKRIAEPEGITPSFVDELIDMETQRLHMHEPKPGFVARTGVMK